MDIHGEDIALMGKNSIALLLPPPAGGTDLAPS
jgi:hypothetical protein